MSDFDPAEWSMLFPASDESPYWAYGLYDGVYSVVDGSRVADITPDRIAHVKGFEVTEGERAETDVLLLVELTDGSWAACMAGCDTTGWDCRASVMWRWAPSLEAIVENGLDRSARKALGMPLAIDAVTSGEAAS